MPFRVDFTTPGFVRPAIDDPTNMTDAQRFFYEHAGWGYHPDHETPEQGRVRGARALADAEEWAKREGLSWRWEEDEFPNWDDDVEREHTDYPQHVVALVRHGDWPEDDEILASLCSIDLGPDGSPSSDPYIRVVAAELALEVVPS